MLGLLLFLLLVRPQLTLAADVTSGAAPTMKITVETETENGWKVVDPATVLDSGTKLRFRFSSSFAGYLYVMNQGSSGAYSTLFPANNGGEDNRIEADGELVLPRAQGSYKIGGPSGYDVLFWVISPVRWNSAGATSYRPLPPPPQSAARLRSLQPRCDDAFLRARGDCVDAEAGVRQVAKPEALPENLSKVPGLQSRDIVFEKGKDSTVVKLAATPAGPVVYEMRIAHK